jgi:hypothetical protein
MAALLLTLIARGRLKPEEKASAEKHMHEWESYERLEAQIRRNERKA